MKAFINVDFKVQKDSYYFVFVKDHLELVRGCCLKPDTIVLGIYKGDVKDFDPNICFFSSCFYI